MGNFLCRTPSALQPEVWPNLNYEKILCRESIPLKTITPILHADSSKPLWSMYYSPLANANSLQVFVHMQDSVWYRICQFNGEESGASSTDKDEKQFSGQKRSDFLFSEIMQFFCDWVPGQISHPQETTIIRNSFRLAKSFMYDQTDHLQKPRVYEKVGLILKQKGVDI